MPPLPKPPGTRRRRNRALSARLPHAPPAKPRPLPERDGGWSPLVIAAWDEWWASPMARRWIEADVIGLVLLAELHERWVADASPRLAGEIRLQRGCYGLSPADRRRLSWDVVEVEEPDPRPPRPSRVDEVDPRAHLRAVDDDGA